MAETTIPNHTFAETARLLAEGSRWLPGGASSGGRLMAGFGELLAARGVMSVVQGVPGSFNVHLGIDRPVQGLADTLRVDAAQVEMLIMALLRRGVRAILGGHWYVNAAHTDALVDETLDVFEDALTEL